MATTPPGPKGIPVLGNARRFSRDPLTFMTACRDAYGDIARFDIGTDEAYLLTNPTDIEYVLTRDTAEFRKPAAQPELQDPLGDGLLLNEGDEIWSRQRRRAQPAFGMKQIAQPARLETIVEYAEEMLAGWEDGETIDVRAETVRLTIKIIVDLMFGVELDDDTVESIQGHLDTIGDSQSGSDVRRALLPDRLARTNPQFQRGVEGLQGILDDIVQERREAGPSGRMSADDDTDFLSIMLDARDREVEVDETFLRDELMTILLAGHDTTSLAITYATYLIAQHSEVATRLQDEADALSTKAELTFGDVRGLKYTDQVLREAMRLYPPVPIVPREPRIDVRVSGYRVPAGSILLMSQWVVQRDPRWYDEPETFDPSRWQPEHAKTRPKYAYFPFGAGPRVCIGKPIAELEAKLIIGTLMSRYWLEPAMDEPLDLEANVTLFPRNPVEVTVHER